MSDRDRDEVRSRFAAVPRRLSEAANDAVAKRVPVGEWGPFEIVRHLIAVEEGVWQDRLGQLASADRPHWPWVEPEPWPGSPTATLGELLATFGDSRARTLGTLDALDDDGWARTGIHETWGEIAVVQLLERAIAHDEEHLVALTGGSGTASDHADAPE